MASVIIATAMTHTSPSIHGGGSGLEGRLDAAREKLRAHGQEHLLAFVDRLVLPQLAGLLDQVDALDFETLEPLIAEYVRARPVAAIPADLKPAPYYALPARHAAPAYDAAKYRALGEEMIRAGKVAAFTVAGGQGTRLGWNGPKGTYPATVVTGKPLFRCFAEQIVAAQRRWNVGGSSGGGVGGIPWYIMTSPANDADTRAFFADNNYFGLRRQNIFFFPQGTLPSIDARTGKLLLAAPHEIAVNPDGHGGSIKALADSGAIDDMLSRGIEHISYFQVDNPLVRTIDPLFLGLHTAAPDSSGEMSSKMVRKTDPAEKVGVFCQADGKTTVIEYSDLPPHLASATNADGSLKFNAGSIAIHIISVAFVQRLTKDAHHFALPYHRADKKVPHIDTATGAVVEPKEPNAVKLETFVFDAIPLAHSSIVLETSRVEEFAPIKNATGGDSPATSHALQTARNAAWLEACGVLVPRKPDGTVDASIEISPLTALDAESLRSAELPREIQRGSHVVL